MIARFTHTILFLLLAKIVAGQMIQSPIRFTNFTIANGLPTNNINHIMEDSRGFVWLSTAQGLVRYDGSRFTIYKHNHTDSNSMPFDDVTDCIELNNHELVFGSGGKMWMLNPVNGKQHPPDFFWNSKMDGWPRKISGDLIVVKSQGKFYFTDFNLQVIDSVYMPASKDFFEVFYLGNNQVLFSDFHSMFCYSLNSKKMEEWKFDKASFSPVTIFFIKDADTLNKKIYVGGYRDGVYTMSYDTSSPDYLKGRKQPVTISGPIGDILYNKPVLIVACQSGLTIQQAGKPEIILKNLVRDNTSILPGDLNDVFAGSDGQYWVAGNNGVSHFNLNQNNYQYWKLPYQSIISHYSKYDNKIWMSTEWEGSLHIDTKTNALQIIDSNIIRYCWGAVPVNNQIYIHGNTTTGKYANDENNVKLLSYNPTTKNISAPTFLQPFYHGAELITLVYQSKNGEVWYSINNGNGLVRQKAGSNDFTQYRKTDFPSPFQFNYLNKAAEDKNGNIYFSVNYSNEVLVWKNNKQQFETWQIDSLLGRRDVHFGPLLNHIVDSKQNLWMSYPKVGLVKYNLETKKGKLYETEDGLPYNDFDNVVADADDNIWFPTPKGLCCLLASTDQFITFTQKDGMPFIDFSNSYIFFDKDDSSLYFSKLGYLYKTNSYDLLKRRTGATVNLVIDDITVNARPYFFSAEKLLQLLPDENNLQFSFTFIDIENKISERNFEYLLTDKSNNINWQKLNGNSNTLSFYHLNAGTYTLQLRMLNIATGKYINSNIFQFTIARIWYKTWWFRLLLSAVIIAVIFILIRNYYLRKLEQQKALLEKEKALEEERIRIAADMHDDVGAGLSRIRYIATAMKEGKNISDEDMDMILSLSDESVEKMNEIIWSLNQGNQQLAELIYHIRSHCAEMVSNANIEFDCIMPDEIPAKMLDWKQTRNIYLLVKEAVNNAIKHAAAKNIAVNFFINHALQITVKDDGKGFNQNTIRKEGNGLLNYKKRVDTLGGNYTILSSPGNGTELKFVVPITIA